MNIHEMLFRSQIRLRVESFDSDVDTERSPDDFPFIDTSLISHSTVIEKIGGATGVNQGFYLRSFDFIFVEKGVRTPIRSNANALQRRNTFIRTKTPAIANGW